MGLLLWQTQLGRGRTGRTPGRVDLVHVLPHRKAKSQSIELEETSESVRFNLPSHEGASYRTGVSLVIWLQLDMPEMKRLRPHRAQSDSSLVLI